MDMVEGQEKKTRARPISVLCADNLMGRYRRNKLLIKSFADRTNCGYRRVGINTFRDSLLHPMARSFCR